MEQEKEFKKIKTVLKSILVCYESKGISSIEGRQGVKVTIPPSIATQALLDKMLARDYIKEYHTTREQDYTLTERGLTIILKDLEK